MKLCKRDWSFLLYLYIQLSFLYQYRLRHILFYFLITLNLIFWPIYFILWVKTQNYFFFVLLLKTFQPWPCQGPCVLVHTPPCSGACVLHLLTFGCSCSSPGTSRLSTKPGYSNGGAAPAATAWVLGARLAMGCPFTSCNKPLCRYRYPKVSAPAGAIRWTECWPVGEKRVTSLLPSQGTCLRCGPGPQ